MLSGFRMRFRRSPQKLNGNRIQEALNFQQVQENYRLKKVLYLPTGMERDSPSPRKAR